MVTRTRRPPKVHPRSAEHLDESVGAAVALAACCAPLTREPLSPEAAVELSAVLKALADPIRLRLVSLIQAHEDGEACVCDLTEPVGLSQPTVSHHLKILLDAGLVLRDKRGVWAYYRMVPGALESLGALIGSPTMV
ncbi:MAG TPA: metalloregulator ArsR/SmtB family transcription factor [Acidimicrobiales bacterium]|nr:metalloregulator ArsR/SmtB family transcription factor [Acidimicrobiales bacterium]